MTKQRILIVDDLAIFREAISIALTHEGYKTICAANGREALAIIECAVAPIEMMIVDYSMPEMDGLTLLQRSRGCPQLGDAPCLMLTDSAEKGHVVKAAQFGAKDYMLKSSFSIPLLLEKVRHFIGTPESKSVQ